MEDFLIHTMCDPCVWYAASGDFKKVSFVEPPTLSPWSADRPWMSVEEGLPGCNVVSMMQHSPILKQSQWINLFGLIFLQDYSINV